MSKTYNIEKTMVAIKAKLGNDNSTTLELKNGVKVIIGRGGYGPEEYMLYLGCELVVGDVPLAMVAKLVCQIAEDTKANLRTQFGDFCVDDDEDESTCSGRDYSPSAPWNAPGMSVKDFI